MGEIALQHSVDVCHTTIQISHNYTYITSLLGIPPFPPSHLFRSSQRARLSSLCYIATSHQLSILYMVVYICRCYFLHPSHSFPPPLCLQVLCPYLHLHSFPANRIDSRSLTADFPAQSIFVDIFISVS